VLVVLALLFGFDLRVASAAPPASGTRTITVKALIDGRSWLVLHGNTAQWYQIDYAAPGRWADHNDPTIINGKTWFPTWPDVPDDDNYSCNCYSSVFRGVTPPLPAGNFDARINWIDTRGAVYFMQEPSADNDYTLIVEFNDDYLDGAAMYEIQLDITPVSTRTFTISAVIDGRSQLWMRGNTAQWVHLDFAAPGRLEGANDPTIIIGKAWYPAWPDVPDAENRDCGCSSSIFRGVKPSVPDKYVNATLNVIQGRGPVYFTSLPSDVTNRYLTLDFDDDAEPGAALYVVEVTIEYPR
jgi:hypothetical protein